MYTCIYKQIIIDLKREIDSNTVIVGKSDTPLDTSSRQKINKEKIALNDTKQTRGT